MGVERRERGTKRIFLGLKIKQERIGEGLDMK
jgi:hypothetical protein